MVLEICCFFVVVGVFLLLLFFLVFLFFGLVDWMVFLGFMVLGVGILGFSFVKGDDVDCLCLGVVDVIMCVIVMG